MKKDKTENTKKSEAERYGIDVQALEDNLKRSYKERIVRHQIAVKTFKKFFNKANE